MSYQRIDSSPTHVFMFRENASFYGELSETRPTSKQGDHTLSAVRDCLFNIFAATLHIGGRHSNRNLMTRHAMVTGIRFSRCHPLHIPTKIDKGNCLPRFHYNWVAAHEIKLSFDGSNFHYPSTHIRSTV